MTLKKVVVSIHAVFRFLVYGRKSHKILRSEAHYIATDTNRILHRVDDKLPPDKRLPPCRGRLSGLFRSPRGMVSQPLNSADRWSKEDDEGEAEGFYCICRNFNPDIAVYKYVAPDTLRWNKDTLLWWPQNLVFSRDCAEAKEFHTHLGEAIAFAEKLSNMDGGELSSLAADLAKAGPPDAKWKLF